MSQTLTVGDGPHHIICLHGWFGHASDWGPFVDYLDQNKFTWHFLDYRGYGSRQAELGDYTLDEISEDVCSYIEQLSADKVSLLGHSMGGTYMQRVFVDSSVPIASMVGISPTPPSGTPFDEQTRQLFESAATSSEARRAIIDMTTGNRLSSNWISHLVSSSFHNSQTTAVGRYFHAWADCDFADEINGKTVPILTIVGAHDPAISTEVIEKAYKPLYSNIRVRELQNAGHYSMFETPLDLQAEIEAFLSTTV